ncbi:GlxA family transcriptional regulator [Ruegeria sp.]|uniref:GlxA family transcriptional regulator n=1 Tax=Ruegeria sp. TaxID=1879320 RepID=UPI003B5A9832
MQDNARHVETPAIFPIIYDDEPKDVYFFLLPNLTMLAFSSAIEPLRIANQITGKQLYNWVTVAEEDTPVLCSNGVPITPNFGRVDARAGSQVFICSGNEPQNNISKDVIAWISRQVTRGCKIGGICTGAFALASAGLLDDKNFTLHWEYQGVFRELFHDLSPTSNLYEIDGTLMTCGGGVAATDMILNMIERDHGTRLASIVADMCLHLRVNSDDTPQRTVFSSVSESRNTFISHAVDIMEAEVENPLSTKEIAERVGVSIRQLERLFNRYAGKPPAKVYNDIRLARASKLLSISNMRLIDIATATGFGNSASFSAHFKRKYGISPSKYKRSWRT